MSIASEITRINTNIAAAYSACDDKGATMPATENSANLADTVASIPTCGELPFIKVGTVEVDAPTNTYTFEAEKIDDNFVFVIMCDQWKTLTPQSNYALYCCVGHHLTINGQVALGTAACTQAMLRSNGTLGIGTPNLTVANDKKHLTWNDGYAYLFPNYTYTAYLLNMGDNTSPAQITESASLRDTLDMLSELGVDVDDY